MGEGIRTHDALIKRKVAKPAVFWVSSQRKLAANLFDSQTIRLTTADQIRLTTCPENVQGPDHAEPTLTGIIPLLTLASTVAARAWTQSYDELASISCGVSPISDTNVDLFPPLLLEQ